MTQNKRVGEIRKALNLTMEKFGERLGVSKTTISGIENEYRNLTEQMTKSICREFGVDYIWLTTGEGEMFVESDDDFMERIDRIMVDESDMRRKLFKALLNADDETLQSLERWIDFCADLKEKD